MRPGLLAPCLALALFGIARGQGVVPPSITAHPTSVTAHPDDVVRLNVTVEGTLPISYQWRKDGAVLAGETNSGILLIASLATPAATYDVVVTNAGGTATSLPALVYVTKHPQTITFTPPATVIAAGSGLRLTATASSGLPVTYSLVSGAASLSGNLLTGTSGNVVIRATQAGDAMFAAADPVERTIQFVAGALSPYITTPLVDQSPLAGTRLSLQVSSVGTPVPTYQWQKDGNPIAGATSSTFAIASLTLADTGRYTVTATNLAGTASSSATITVRSPPVITTLPESQTVTAGNPVTLTVVADGNPAVTYQWRRNGTNLAGATRASYSLALVTSANAGNYDVVVTNALGTVTSPAATLTVFTRDFSGTYWGEFPNGAGKAVLVVRPDGTAAFFAHLPGLPAGIAAPLVSVDLAGRFSARLPLIAATARDVTLAGTIDEVAGRLTGTIAELDVSFEATRALPATPAVAAAGLYTAALVGSGAGRGYVILGPDGQAFLITAAGTAVETAQGMLGANGRVAATTSAQTAIDLGFTDGVLRGTVRTPAGVSGTILGAIHGLAGTEHLVNLSVRGATAPQAPMITGFAIGGTVAKQVLIRVAGPAIGRAPFNIAGALPDPNLQLFRVTTNIGQNDNWGQPGASATAIAAATTRVGAFPFPNNSPDAALLTTLQPGVYTVQIGGGTGVVLAEIYEVPVANEAPGSRRLVNASTRGIVTPEIPLIAGFVITGAAPQRVLIRAIGPTLGAAPFNLPGVLPNPTLSLFRGSTPVKGNDDWFRDPEAALIRDAATRVRAFALGAQSLDAAMVIQLEPGAYTAVVGFPANAPPAATTGIVLVEIYEASL